MLVCVRSSLNLGGRVEGVRDGWVDEGWVGLGLIE